MKRPLIGINCKFVPEGDSVYYKLDRLYVKAVWAAGGAPVLLPFLGTAREVAGYLERLDGLLLTGGADINPARWSEPKHPESKLLHPEKERSDFLLVQRALERNLPIFGVCYGCQLINVTLGGTLHQHLPDLPGVRAHRRRETMHAVELARATRLRELLGAPSIRVNSYHHQGIRDVGRDLAVTAISDDGIVEGVEGNRHPYLVAVQWHPERLESRRDQKRLFGALISAARR